MGGYLQERNATIRVLWEQIEEKEEKVRMLTETIRRLQTENNEMRMMAGRRPRYP